MTSTSEIKSLGVNMCPTCSKFEKLENLSVSNRSKGSLSKVRIWEGARPTNVFQVKTRNANSVWSTVVDGETLSLQT